MNTFAGTFNNPIIVPGADPTCLYYNGAYYYMQTDGGTTLYLRKSSQIAGPNGITTATPIPIFTVPAPYNFGVEAPEIKIINGTFFVYYAAGLSGDSNDTTHRMWCIRANTPDPVASGWTLMGQVCDPSHDFWSIDGNVLQSSNGTNYFVWCSRTGSANSGGSRLYIAPMSNPWTIVNNSRVELSHATFSWEFFGSTGINEAPTFLYENGNTFIIYSANCSCANNYCLGQLKNTDGNLLNPGSWTKSSLPVFQLYSGPDGSVFAPGSCAFTVSPDRTQNWIIYHTAQSSGSGFTRWIQAQPFTLNSDGSPNLGHPFPTGDALALPSDDQGSPQIVTDISPTIVKSVGKTLILQTMVYGQLPISYQWKYNGGNLVNGERISGAQSNLLTIANAQLSDAGNHQLFASNSVGWTNSSVAVVTVTNPVNVIYYNKFRGKLAVALEGTSPDIANAFAGGSGRALWNNTSSNFYAVLANGTAGASGGDEQNSSLLPFTPQTAALYRLTASVNLPADSGDWVGMGFSQFNPDTVVSNMGRMVDALVNGNAWMLVRTSTSPPNEQGFAGPGGTNPIFDANLIPGGAATTASLEIDLDTTKANWGARMFINGAEMGETNYTVNPTIRAVGLTQNSGAVGFSWNEMELQSFPATAPSFTSAALGSDGAVGLSGSGGLPHEGFEILCTTNMALPPTNWDTVMTGAFDEGGDFNVTNMITHGAPQSFYILRVL